MGQKSQPKVLFITSPGNDFQADTLLHGLRSLWGDRVIDYPKADPMYESVKRKNLDTLHGRGFTLYGLLPDLPIDRSNIVNSLQDHAFELVIFSSIWRQTEFFAKFRRYLNPQKTVFVDGEDSGRIFPVRRRFLLPKHWASTYLGKFKRSRYFKREWNDESSTRFRHLLFPFLPRIGQSGYFENISPISFGIPEAKILKEVSLKTQRFATHVVDQSLLSVIPGSSSSYPFSDEESYYKNLSNSEFGITTKRGGWDCLRHYEIAANSCIPCFKNLSLKPVLSAPHGLVPGINCISYRDSSDLLNQTSQLSDSDKQRLAQGALAWASKHSTVAVATNFLAALGGIS